MPSLGLSHPHRLYFLPQLWVVCAFLLQLGGPEPRGLPGPRTSGRSLPDAVLFSFLPLSEAKAEHGAFPPAADFSSKPQALATPSKEERGKRKKKGKGLGKKRDPCLRKYKDFCIHGECKYVKELRAPSCM